MGLFFDISLIVLSVLAIIIAVVDFIVFVKSDERKARGIICDIYFVTGYKRKLTVLYEVDGDNYKIVVPVNDKQRYELNDILPVRYKRGSPDIVLSVGRYRIKRRK